MSELEKDVEVKEQEVVEQDTEQKEEVDYESIIAQLREDNAKLKKAFDKSASDLSNTKKQLRARQTAEEIANEEREEKWKTLEERCNTLEREKKLSELEKSYLASGYDVDSAKKSAEAMLGNDYETLFKIQREQSEARVKRAEAEWIKSRPEVKTGGKDEEKDPFILGFDS